jgi:NADH-quinone oxidoreductase subunit L
MLLKLVTFLPLIGFIIASLASRLEYKIAQKNIDQLAQIITTSFLIISAICAIKIFFDISSDSSKSQIITLASWISSGNFNANWALKLDQLTAIMLVVVTFVSSLVHVYSIGYMKEDQSIARFMSYLSLFTFFMLILITADNFIQLFVGWEGVGLASYLLIGFWFKKESANLAAMKAFIVNRIGDFGLIIAIALIYSCFGSVEFSAVFDNVKNHLNDNFVLFGSQINMIDAICILLFIGAMGKSAQIGLHVWLADAMEGPTPVSALIHAATMVTAGIFLVARCSPIFEHSEIALAMVTLVGAMTAIFAATIAITQNDIKKIIAYSTCSQLGYMFFACGVSAYSAGIFHLATHACFKALLFLSAGSVIHAMHHEQDITKMGEKLYKKIPITYAMMWIGSLALAGFPPFSGFYSKDVILEAAYMSHSAFGKTAYILGISAAFLTAFYSWRLIFVAFHGSKHHHGANHHGDKHHHQPHESPLIMLIPLFLLALGSIFFGLYGAKFLNMVSAENNFFNSAIFVLESNQELLEDIHHIPNHIKYLPIIIGVIAISLAYVFYILKTSWPKKLSKSFRLFYNISLNKWYFDEIYEAIFVKPTRVLGNFLSKFFDIKIIDNMGPNGAAKLCKLAANKISKLQTGYIYDYSLAMILGVVFAILYLMISFSNYF